MDPLANGVLCLSTPKHNGKSGTAKTIKLSGICCCSAKHTTLRSENKDWLARNQNNVFECSDMSTRSVVSES